MFDDFLNSARGPGVIGLLLATVVLAFLSVMMIGALTGEEGENYPKQIAEQKLRIERLKMDIEFEEEEIAKREGFARKEEALEELRGELEGLKEKEGGLSTRVTWAGDDLKEVQQSLDDYKARYRANERERAVGENIDLSATHGEMFKNVRITGVNPTDLRVMTENGPKGVPYKELPKDVQDRFQFDEEEAKRFLQAREEYEAARDRAIRGANQKRFEKQEEWREEERKRKNAKDLARAKVLREQARKARSRASAFRTQAASARSAHAAAVARGNFSSHLARATALENKAAGAMAYADDLEAKARELESGAE